ncbi:hypothetical protein FOL46_000354 [Perkinsus olseni]|uniref:Uncharacterized protein n=1 Tax=Perkinsus olseni TaxID=32597 RepID=A0A7J6KVL7_PEROL|nr:hypothetical protein FOL46_000354 [Perkinsus olseni]
MAKRKRSGKPVAADIITTEASDAVDTGIGTSSTQAVTDHNCCGSNSGTAELPHGGQSTDVVAVVGYESTNTVPNGVYTPVVVPPGSGQEEEDSTSMLPIQWPDTLQDAAVAVRASTTKLTDTKEENIPPAVSPSSPWLTWEEVIGLNLKEEEEESGGINTVTAEVVPDDNKPDTSQLSSSKPIPASVTEGDDRKGPEDEEEEEESGGNLFPDESDSSPVVAAPVEPTQPASAAPSTQPTSPALNAKEKKREWFQALYSNDGAKAAPCRYYAQGRCTKGDACPYSHDDAAAAKLRKAHHDALAAIPCKFHVVLGHGCREGDACRYSHQVERFPCVRQSITGHCGGGPSQCPMLHYPVAVRQTEAFKIPSAWGSYILYVVVVEVATDATGGSTDVAPAKRPRISKALDKVNKAMEKKCPYLGTVNRNMLDFDFEKVCSVTLSNENVYACLVCGKYYTGRGQGTCAYTHALEKKHYVFINLKDTRVYCIPDGYEIIDASLDDIRYNLNPTFTKDMLNSAEDKSTAIGFTLDGRPFLPGCVGLNTISGGTDYLNVVVQILQQVTPLRNALLTKKQDLDVSRTGVTEALAELFRKTYNAKNFKGVVSPHEFLQVVSLKSKKHFFTSQRDPAEFLTWLLNHLRHHKTINKIFKGEILVKTCKNLDSQAAGDVWEESTSDFLTLTLDLPDAPLFKDTQEFIPQVPMISLLDKFNGETVVEDLLHRQLRKYSIKRLPPYLIFVTKRFKKNNFTVEKNPTLVRFPLKGLDMKDWIHPTWHNINEHTKYDLVGLVSHSGQPEAGMGVYKAYVLHSKTNQWQETHDLNVAPILPQSVALMETYIQVYQREDVQSDGTFTDNIVLAKRGEEEEDIFGGTDENMKDRDLALAGIEIG